MIIDTSSPWNWFLMRCNIDGWRGRVIQIDRRQNEKQKNLLLYCIILFDKDSDVGLKKNSHFVNE